MNKFEYLISTLQIHFAFFYNFPENLPLNLVDGQYVFANQTDTFEANLAVASEYCASLDSNPVSQQETTITPLINVLASTYDETNESNSEITLSVQSSDISNNCITYNNVVFVPTIINDDNQQAQIENAIELIKNETNAQKPEQNANQCVLSSDSSFVNTFLQPPNINGNAATVLCETPTQAFNGTNKSHPTNAIAIDANGISTEMHQMDQHQQQMYQIVDSNHVNIGMASGAEPEVFLQDENGHLYRPVQNIYVDGTTMCSNELLPNITTPINIASNPTYVCSDQVTHLQAMQNTYQQNSGPTPYEIPVNFISTAESNERTTVNTEVQFIFDGYGGNDGSINGINQSNAIGSNQFQIETNAEATNYQTQFEMQSNKEQQSLLESTMSTLCKFLVSISLESI